MGRAHGKTQSGAEVISVNIWLLCGQDEIVIRTLETGH